MTAARQARGAAARLSRRRAWVLAVAWQMLRGYRIQGCHLPNPLGEIDLLTQRGCVLTVIKSKCRSTLEAVLDAVTTELKRRLRRAAARLVAHSRELKDIEVRLDLIALATSRRPRHLRDAWQEGS